MNRFAHSRQERVEPSKRTLGDYLTSQWLPLQQAGKKPSTYSGYKYFVENRIVPELGDTKLTELTSGEIARLCATLRVGGRKDGKERGSPNEASSSSTRCSTPRSRTQSKAA